MDAKNLYDGIGRLLTVSSRKEVPKPVNNREEKSVTENGVLPSEENGISPVEQTEDVNADGVGDKSPPPPLQTDENPSAPVSV